MAFKRTRVQVNKSHKCRFSSKSSCNANKTSSSLKGRIAKIERNVVVGKGARIQRNKMIREQKMASVLQQKRQLRVSTTPARVILLFALSASVDLESLADDLLSLLSQDSSMVHQGLATPTVDSPKYKIKISVLKAPHGNLLACMRMVKVADLVVFVASARSLCKETHPHYIDSFGHECLSVFRSLGLPNTVLFVRDLPTELKQRNELKNICSSSLASEFPEDCKCYPADREEDLQKFLWLFKEQRPKIPHWRTHRSYLMAHKVDAVCDGISSDKCTLCLTGYLRGRNLSVNQQVHVSGAGDFRLCKIDVLEDPFLLNSRKNQDQMDSAETHGVEVIRSLVPDPQNQEDVIVENGEKLWAPEVGISAADEDQKQKKMRKRKIPPGTSDDQIRTSEVDISTAYEVQKQKKMRKWKLPPGTSDYQAEWYFDDSNEEKSDGNGASLSNGDTDEETGNDSMMEVDNMTREDILADLKAIKEENAADEEFPDEVDTPLDIPARMRFTKYRGLESSKYSPWDPNESLPQDYPTNFNYHNFKRTQKHVLAKALETEQENREDCVPVGSYIRLHIMEVPNDVASKLCMLPKANPVTACGLLEHECDVSVLHFSVKKHETYHAPIKSKEELIFHVGFREFVSRPIFSSELNTDRSKMERFLHAGRFSLASVCAKISFPSLPTIILKRAGEDATPAVVASGSLKTVDRDRIILKRVILTGYPQRVSHSKAYVKHMFYNPDDVKFFKHARLLTKKGRQGRIVEPVGTHGAMKCTFNGVVEQSDTVRLSLFKRVYPEVTKSSFCL